MGNILLEVFKVIAPPYNANLHRITCKMPLLQKNKYKIKKIKNKINKNK